MKLYSITSLGNTRVLKILGMPIVSKKQHIYSILNGGGGSIFLCV